MSNYHHLPEWLREDFTVRCVPSGYILMDGDRPVSGHPHTTRASANRVMRECQQQRDARRAEVTGRMGKAA